MDLIINCVDNTKSLNYIDNQVVWYEKPMIECETLGLKGHSYITIPFKTNTYSDMEHPS